MFYHTSRQVIKIVTVLVAEVTGTYGYRKIKCLLEMEGNFVFNIDNADQEKNK